MKAITFHLPDGDYAEIEAVLSPYRLRPAEVARMLLYSCLESRGEDEVLLGWIELINREQAEGVNPYISSSKTKLEVAV